VALVTWRDGVHLTNTPIWCDARRRRDVCFVSSADRVGRAGHGQLVATPLTLALLGASGGGHLGVPLHQRFTLGTVRLELIASGRGPGAASLHVDLGGKTVLYAGAVRPDEAEVRASDAVVVAAPYGEPRHRFPALAKVKAETLAWTRAQLATGHRPLLFVDTVLDGLEIAAALAAEGIATAAGRAIRDAALRAGNQLATPGKEPRAVVWLDGDRAGALRALAGKNVATALVSARAVDDGVDTTDAAFAWPNAADRKQLLAWIESTRARDVFVTGACAESIVAALGSRARMLGPPHQMSLFPREAMP
jgi:hypothetical protein